MWSRQVARTEGARYRISNRSPWSPAQVVLALVALIFIVIGGAALARAGVDFHAVPFSRTQVAGLWFTNMSALITLLAGVVLLIGAADPMGAKASVWFFGVLLIAFGLIVAISPAPFTNMWGYSAANGIFYIIAGAILVIAGVVSPVFYSRQAVVSQSQIIDHETVPVEAAPVEVHRVARYESSDRVLEPWACR